MPYRHPEVFYSTSKLTGLFAEKGIDTVLIITDAGIRKFGLSLRKLFLMQNKKLTGLFAEKGIDTVLLIAAFTFWA